MTTKTVDIKKLWDDTNDRDETIVAYRKATGVSLSKATKTVADWLKANGIVTANRAAGFTADYYEWLLESPRSVAEAAKFIEANGSENTKRHLAFWQGIAELVNDVRNSK